MKTGKKKLHLIKEEEKIRQVTHWDLDYLPKDEILNMYKRGSGHGQKNSVGFAEDKSHERVSLLLIAMGLLLLAGALYVTSLI